MRQTHAQRIAAQGGQGGCPQLLGREGWLAGMGWPRSSQNGQQRPHPKNTQSTDQSASTRSHLPRSALSPAPPSPSPLPSRRRSPRLRALASKRLARLCGLSSLALFHPHVGTARALSSLAPCSSSRLMDLQSERGVLLVAQRLVSKNDGRDAGCATRCAQCGACCQNNMQACTTLRLELCPRQHITHSPSHSRELTIVHDALLTCACVCAVFGPQHTRHTSKERTHVADQHAGALQPLDSRPSQPLLLTVLESLRLTLPPLPSHTLSRLHTRTHTLTHSLQITCTHFCTQAECVSCRHCAFAISEHSALSRRATHTSDLSVCRGSMERVAMRDIGGGFTL